MFVVLISRLEGIRQGYGDAIIIADEIFNALKLKNLKVLPSLTTRQIENVTKLRSEKDCLGKEINDIARSQNIEGNRLQHLLHLAPQLQKEQIIDLQRDIIRKEEESNRALYRNQEYLNILLSTTEAIVDAAIHLNNENNQESRMFLDKKF